MLSPEYRAWIRSSEWRDGFARNFTLRWLTFGQDCVVPLVSAHDADHLTYTRFGGGEIPLVDLVPLHRFIHRAVVTHLRRFLRMIPLGAPALNLYLRFCCLRWWGLVVLMLVHQPAWPFLMAMVLMGCCCVLKPRTLPWRFLGGVAFGLGCWYCYRVDPLARLLLWDWGLLAKAVASLYS